MTTPIVFISRNRIKPGRGEEFATMAAGVLEMIHEAKPRTALFAAYLDAAGDEVRVVHAFPDSEAMTAHFEGSGERSQQAYEIIQPAGFEVLGAAPDAAVDQLRREATRAGVPLGLWLTSAGGYLRNVT